ncbi:sigma factor-like helix-turn-helix DNA-binding protein [Sporosarcina highlanderae]|uniref:Sigma factor-like helix-turn-helix DNA-binding protein n=1 Tax=Sporosarcina highlanderae TaxID=3035916 RepID=A0ABT8JPW2_9BACL|nr:sigma factor-like helix-turn-helix DNA-binding protein [Sporosarcina highlanderae]MDN4606616.1 sigma factor-like helix-turn-helix DNA-binding protein [Sporosarcina highlanderae]
MNTALVYPLHITEIEAIQSPQIMELVKSQDPLKELRDLYISNRGGFFLCIEELTLRGIRVTAEANHNYFPRISNKYSHWIISTVPGKLFKEVNFDLLGLGGFIAKFDVKDDTFFHLVPLEGFIHLNKSIDLSSVINAFIAAGFLFNKEMDYQSNDDRSQIVTESRKPFPLSTIKVHTPLLIKDFLSDRKFNRLLDFCNANGYIGLFELNKEVISTFELTYYRSIRHSLISKVNGLLDITVMIAKTFDSEEEALLKMDIRTHQIYNVLESLSIEAVAEVLNVDLTDTPLDIKQMNISEVNCLAQEKRKVFLSRLMPIQSLDTIANTLKVALNENELTAFTYRADPSKTFEVIGNIMGVTRERVRQIVVKAEMKIMEQVRTIGYPQTILLLKSCKFGIAEDRVKNYLSGNNQFLLEILNKIPGGLIYYPRLKQYFTPEESALLEKVFSNSDWVNGLVLFEDFQAVIQRIISNSRNEEFLEEIVKLTLTMLGYKKYGKFISGSRITITKKLEIIFEDYLKEPILIDEEGMKKLNYIAKDLFGEKFEGSFRNIDSRIRDLENVILVDPKTYKKVDQTILEDSLWDEIYNYIVGALSEQDQINIEQVFLQFEDSVNQIGVYSKLHLYSLVKYLFEDDFEIGKGNTLNIYKQGTEKRSIEDILETYLEKNKNETTRDKIAENLKWKQYKLDLLISKSHKFIQWDDGIVKLMNSFDFDGSELIEMRKFLDAFMYEGYSTSVKLYTEFQFDTSMSIFLNKHEINSDYVLGNLLKKLFPEIKGHTVFLYREDSKITSAEEALLSRFTEVTSRQEISDFLGELGYSLASIGQLTSLVLQKRLYVPIDTEDLLRRDKLLLESSVLEAVQAFLEKEFKDREYLVINNLLGYRRKLPIINYMWTYNLIHTIGLELGYKNVRANGDYRYDKLILVKSSSNISSLDELVYTLLNDGGAIHQSKCLEFIIETGLVRSTSQLPIMLRDSDLFTIDELGWMSFKGSELDGFR